MRREHRSPTQQYRRPDPGVGQKSAVLKARLLRSHLRVRAIFRTRSSMCAFARPKSADESLGRLSANSGSRRPTTPPLHRVVALAEAQVAEHLARPRAKGGVSLILQTVWVVSDLWMLR